MDKEGYRRGSHTVTDLKYHFVWKTKYSYGVMKAEVALRLRDIIREICAEKGLAVVKGNIRPNHVHILISAPPYYLRRRLRNISKAKVRIGSSESSQLCRSGIGVATSGAGDIFVPPWAPSPKSKSSNISPTRQRN